MLPAQCSSLSCAVHHVTFVHESILQKKKGTFQHSSFLAGGATSAAGRLVVEDGVLKVLICLIYITVSSAELLMLSLISSRNSEFRQITNTLTHSDDFLQAIWPHSGHYRPTEENFQEFQSFLKDKSVDLTDVKVSIV